MYKKIGKIFYMFVCGVLVFQLVGCGTILYPERKGQKSGKIDIGVALLDGVGLLFFLIPGIIAYVVDFNNGTIYLPGGPLSSLETENLQEIQFDPKNSSLASIEKLIKDETGCDVKLYRDQMEIVELKSPKDIRVHFAEALPEMKNGRIVLLKK